MQHGGAGTTSGDGGLDRQGGTIIKKCFVSEKYLFSISGRWNLGSSRGFQLLLGQGQLCQKSKVLYLRVGWIPLLKKTGSKKKIQTLSVV